MADLKLKVYNFEGKELGTQNLDPKLFGVEINPVVVQQMVVAQQKNAREPIAHTKGRSEVRGGGKKPWRQKGTGRARHGSSRSPIWTGGGITFGPTSSRNFSVKINKKVKAKALAMVLTDKVANDKVILLESYNLPDAKTKMLVAALDKLPVKDRSVLIATKSAEENIVTAAKNLPKVDTTYFGSFNVVDLLKYEYLVINKELLQKVTELYS